MWVVLAGAWSMGLSFTWAWTGAEEFSSVSCSAHVSKPQAAIYPSCSTVPEHPSLLCQGKVAWTPPSVKVCSFVFFNVHPFPFSVADCSREGLVARAVCSQHDVSAACWLLPDPWWALGRVSLGLHLCSMPRTLSQACCKAAAACRRCCASIPAWQTGRNFPTKVPISFPNRTVRSCEWSWLFEGSAVWAI